jgi:ABC-type bacteriocin/lantibiotic exporter with double-glycine peptidase domain
MTPVYLAVPHLPQPAPGECLAACVEMVLTYLSRPVAYARLLKLLQVKSGWGTPAANIRYLEKLNLDIIYQPGTLAELYDYLRQGRPCIAFIKTGELAYWDEDVDHAVVVVGLDDRFIYVNDPAFPEAPLQVARAEFDLAWLEWDEKYAVLIPRTG